MSTSVQEIASAEQDKGWIGRIQFASVDALRKVVEDKQACHFVWPDEGKFADQFRFVFGPNTDECRPVMVDLTTAHMLVKVLDTLKPHLAAKVEQMIAEDRKSFMLVVATGWKVMK